MGEGRSHEQLVEENQKVKSGELLTLIDDRDYQNKLEQYQADLAFLKAWFPLPHSPSSS